MYFFFSSGFGKSNKVGICPEKVLLKKPHMGVTHKDFCQTQKVDDEADDCDD